MPNKHTKAQATERNLAVTSELPTITQGDNILVDARLLHQKLKSKRQFADWVKDKIVNTLFKDSQDYFSQKSEKLGVGRKGLDYLITIDTAKHIAMLENNEVGYAIRQRFIEIEKQARGISQLPREAQLFKGLKAKNINGRYMYGYKEILRRCGYSTSSSSSSRKAKYWMHFVQADKLLYITDEYATHLHHSRQVYNNRKVMQASKPVIPTLFGDNSFLPTLKF